MNNNTCREYSMNNDMVCCNDSFLSFPLLMDNIDFCSCLVPIFKVEEKKDHYELHTEITGMSRNELELKVSENQLILEGHKKKSMKSRAKNSKIVSTQNSCDEFITELNLPQDALLNKMDARFTKGKLEINVPKKEQHKEKNIVIH